MIETIILILEIPANALGSTTFKKQLAEKGLEADECYYVANNGAIRNQRQPDLQVDPPPDLTVEIEITSSLIDKLPIYAGIGVPEVWKFDGDSLVILVLQPDQTYVISETSPTFPVLPTGELVRFIDEYDPSHETRWRWSFVNWVRNVLLPIDRGQARPE